LGIKKHLNTEIHTRNAFSRVPAKKFIGLYELHSAWNEEKSVRLLCKALKSMLSQWLLDKYTVHYCFILFLVYIGDKNAADQSKASLTQLAAEKKNLIFYVNLLNNQGLYV